MKKTFLYGLLSITLLGACSKTNDPEPVNGGTDGVNLTEVQYYNNGTKKATKIVEVLYDANFTKITGVKTFTTSEVPMVDYKEVIYNAQNKIEKISGVNKQNSDQAVTWEFKYDAAGHVIESKRTMKGTSATLYFSYDAEGRVKSGSDFDQTYTYTYAGTSKNPESASVFSKHTFNTSTVNYKFDTQKNPYNKAGMILYFMASGEFFENNLTEVKWSNGVNIAYNYEYNNSGLPLTKRDATSGGGLNFVYK